MVIFFFNYVLADIMLNFPGIIRYTLSHSQTKARRAMCNSALFIVRGS